MSIYIKIQYYLHLMQIHEKSQIFINYFFEVQLMYICILIEYVTDLF